MANHALRLIDLLKLIYFRDTLSQKEAFLNFGEVMEQHNIDKEMLMHWYQKPIAWAFIILLFLISIISWVSLSSLSSIQKEYVSNSQVQVQKLRLLDEMVHYSRQRSVLLRDIVISSDPFEKDEIIQKHSNLATRYLLSRNALSDLPLSPQEKFLIDFIVQNSQQGYGLQNHIIELSLADETEEAIKLLNNDLGPNREKVYPAMLEFRELLVKASKIAADDVNNVLGLSSKTVKWLYAIILFIGTLVAWLVYRQDRDNYRKITWQASYDVLTGLLNRQQFEKILSEAVDKAHTGKYHSALLYIDIDQFNMINNTSGHAAGDELLRQVAANLKTCVGADTTVGRMGGDQFAVLLPNIGEKEALHCAEDIIHKIRENRFVWMNRTYPVTLSIGVLFTSTELGNLEDIWTGAYIACDLAKEAGGNQLSIYKPDNSDIVKRRKQLDWSTRIKSALYNEDLILYSQPIISGNNQPVHNEILLRYKINDGTNITADQFIPAAERYNLITDIDIYVVKKTLEFMKDDKEKNCYSINLSGTTLGNNLIARKIINLIYEYEIDPELICFEVTETAAITNKSSAIRFMNILHGIGCHFFLDDFGSGLSSFGYLRTLPIDAIKIDGYFIKNMEADSANLSVIKAVKNMEADSANLSVIKAVNNIAHGFGLKTIAESVESPEQLKFLKEIGVDYFQGFYLQKPVRLVAA
jgi:diguanylate cyclase (GGDEF)-like protein